MSIIKNNIYQKVFDCGDIENIIYEFAFGTKCLSCKKNLRPNIDKLKYKKYWDYNWQKCRNLYSKYPVCNWCYYYVWEYP